MKTLEELVKELGLKPYVTEIIQGRTGNYVCIKRKKYVTVNDPRFHLDLGYEVIEVKPE